MMKFPKLYRLRKAIRSLDVNFIAKRIAMLEEQLMHQGQDLEPENTAITEEGIFYISPESGMATKVVLYLADHPGPDVDPTVTGLDLVSETRAAIVNKQQEYHILRCNALRNLETQGWKGNYRIAQRTDGTFSCRVTELIRKRRQIIEEHREIDNQRLFICPNCFIKVTSLLEGVREMRRDNFNLKYFFDVDFTRSWCRHEKFSKDMGSLDSIYPRDWLEISRIRKKQVHYYCESCETDLSHPNLRKYLYVHYTDHMKRKVAYVKLECLCIGCLAELPAHSHLKALPDYERYQEGRCD